MAQREDRSAVIHERDGLLRKGRVVGHSDVRGRIRGRDGRFFRGKELGHIDGRGRVRRKGSALGRSDVVGKLRGNALYADAGVLRVGARWGHIDATGCVWQSDNASFRGKMIGRARGPYPHAALAYFALLFEELADHTAVLEEKVARSHDKYAFLPRVRALLDMLPRAAALGDFDDLLGRLTVLERVCVDELEEHFVHGTLRERGARARSC